MGKLKFNKEMFVINAIVLLLIIFLAGCLPKENQGTQSKLSSETT